MKVVQTLSIVVCIFLVTWSAGDGAPQWRPQGRFGKRYSTGRNDFMSALEAGSLADTDASLDSLLLNDRDMDLVSNNNDDLDNFFESNAQSGLSSSGIASSSSSMTSSRWPYPSSRICIETSLPGVFRCHRKGRPGTSLATLQE